MPKKQKKKKKIPVEIITCSQCRGEGVVESGGKCSVCQGLGVFLRVGENGRYYWKEKLSGVSPTLRSLFEILPKAIILFLYLLIFVTLGYGIYFVIINNPDFLELIREDIEYVAAESIMETWFFMILRVIYRFVLYDSESHL